MVSPIISSQLRRSLLTHYFTHPHEKYYLREIAVLLNLDPGNLSKEIRKLLDEGLLELEQKGKVKFYHLNRHYPLYEELRQIIFKTGGIEGSLRKIFEELPKVELAFIYGSYARGEERASSDVDVIVVGNPDRKQLTSRIRTLESRLQREINLHLYNPSEFREKSRLKGNFLSEISKREKIILKGKLHGKLD